MTTVNMNLAEKQVLTTKDIQLVELLHYIRKELFEELLSTEEDVIRTNRKEYTDKLWAIEEKLQEVWKFGVNQNYYRFWEVPRCTCPKMDNDDSYPYGRYVISSNCPLHGWEE
jgi:hypothetical protein